MTDRQKWGISRSVILLFQMPIMGMVALIAIQDGLPVLGLIAILVIFFHLGIMMTLTLPAVFKWDEPVDPPCGGHAG